MEALTRAVYCEMEDPAFPLPYILYTTECILTKLEGWWLLQHLHIRFLQSWRLYISNMQPL